MSFIDDVKGLATKGALAGVITFVAVVGFAVIAVVLWGDVDSATDTQWARKTYILAGVEAITFAAVGWLFGKEVHRERAEAAEKTAEAAQTKVDAKAAEAANAGKVGATAAAAGRSLRDAILAKQEALRDKAGGENLEGIRGASTHQAASGEIDELAHFAKLQFPHEP